MIRWLRVVWPPGWALISVALFGAGWQAVLFFLEWRLQAPFGSLDEEKVFVGVMGALALAYAVYRLAAFHPALRPDYCRWLSSTPWTSRIPLPMGPPHLVLQDVLMLGLIVAAGWPRLQWLSLVSVQVFLFAYLMGLGATHFLTGERLRAYAVALGLGFMGLGVLDLRLFLVAGAGTYALAYLGLRVSLARLPWEGSVISPLLGTRAARQPLGWPYDRLGPLTRGPVPLRDALLTGALAGWWFFAGHYHFRTLPDAAGNQNVMYLVFLGAGVLVRLALYCDGHVPPISLMGRLMHGRWIIPGYDQVFIAPLLAGLVAVAARFASASTEIPPIVVTSVAFALTWSILLGVGPTLQAWRLTGNHRIVAGTMGLLAQPTRGPRGVQRVPH
jgi:hypothetical protein